MPTIVASPTGGIETASNGVGAAAGLVILILAKVLEATSTYGGDQPGAGCHEETRAILNRLTVEKIQVMLSRRAYPSVAGKRYRRYKPSTRN